MIGIAVFFCLAGASLGSLFLYQRIPERFRQDDTNAVVRLAANLFVVMTSLVLGLMINSAKNTYESIDRNLHSFATELILLDRTLRHYGPETAETRKPLLAYVTRVVEDVSPETGAPVVANRLSELMLMQVGDGLRSIEAQTPQQEGLLQEAREHFRKIVDLRWILIEQSEGTIPSALMAMLVAWLVLIFASFGFRAPRNPVVAATCVLSSALIACSIYLVLDMDVPFSGPIQISPAPLQRALAEMQR